MERDSHVSEVMQRRVLVEHERGVHLSCGDTQEIDRSFALVDVEYLLVARGEAVRETLLRSGHDFHPATFVITTVGDLLAGLGYDCKKMLATLEGLGREGLLDRAIRTLEQHGAD